MLLVAIVLGFVDTASPYGTIGLTNVSRAESQMRNSSAVNITDDVPAKRSDFRFANLKIQNVELCSSKNNFANMAFKSEDFDVSCKTVKYISNDLSKEKKHKFKKSPTFRLYAPSTLKDFIDKKVLKSGICLLPRRNKTIQYYLNNNLKKRSLSKSFFIFKKKKLFFSNERNTLYNGHHGKNKINPTIKSPKKEAKRFPLGAYDNISVITESVYAEINYENAAVLSSFESNHFSASDNITLISEAIFYRSTSVSTTDLLNQASSNKFRLYSRSSDETSSVYYLNSSNIPEVDHIVEVFKSRYPVDVWTSYGIFTEEFLHKINRHWLQFSPPRHSSHYILAALYSIIMTVGLIGNSLVIFMFLRCKSLQTPANILVMNLAVSDFLLLLKMPIFIINSFYFGPVLGALGCQIYGFVGGLTGTVSIMTLAAIALDRYYVIVYPLDPLRRTTRQRARICVCFVWVYGSIFASLPLTNLGFNNYVPEGYLTSCSFDYLTHNFTSRLFIFIFFVAAWVVPFCIITFCYFCICRGVIKATGASSRYGQEHEKRKTELRLAGVVIGVVGLWFLSWTPYAIVALLGITGHEDLILPLASMIPALFCKTASCVDPYIYAITHPRFHRELIKMCCYWRTRKKNLQRIQSFRNTCWRTDITQTVVKFQDQQPEMCSNEDVEEIVIMADIVQKDETDYSCFQDNKRKMCAVSFPLDRNDSLHFTPPSWFVPPKPKKTRSTSMKAKFKDVARKDIKDPQSI